jgi:hypothetical protein
MIPGVYPSIPFHGLRMAQFRSNRKRMVGANLTTEREGNHSFFMLAVRLRSAGLDPCQIKATLENAAASAHSPAERKQQISSIMKSLGKKRQ